MNDLKEVLAPWNAMLFKEEMMAPIFCKPKLIPLKTVTTEKLEKMQQDAIDKLRALEEVEAVEHEQKRHGEQENAPDDPSQTAEPSETNIWKADD